jgi:histidinol dehydrogenase
MNATIDAAGVRRLDSGAPDFDARLSALLAWEASQDAAIERTVADILADVRKRGDAAVLDYTRRFDRVDAGSMAELEIGRGELQAALDGLEPAIRQALEAAAARVRAYHEHQLAKSWSYTEADGTRLGQVVAPLDRAGLYVPGGKAAYPSSVLMNALPAKVAGVAELIMVVPTPDGVRNPLVLAAARIAGVDRVFAIGGAQAIGALAYGTETIPRSTRSSARAMPGWRRPSAGFRHGRHRHDRRAVRDPRHLRRQHRPRLDRDGPVFAGRARRDGAGDPADARRRLHRARGRVDRPPAADDAARAGHRAVAGRPRRAGPVRDLDEACEIANRIAPEHLEISTDEPQRWADRIRHAGAIFLGRYTSESLGDYCAGPNHVLPTMRTARFSSPLGVYDFQKRSSLIEVSPDGARALGRIASPLARGEGLQAHARSAEMRFETKE